MNSGRLKIAEQYSEEYEDRVLKAFDENVKFCIGRRY